MMVPKKSKGWSWKKGKGLGLTGETVGSSHVAALYGGALLQSHRYQAMAAALAERLAKTRKIGAATKLRIVEAGKRHLKHIAPRKMMKNMTRPQAMAAIGSLLAGVALAAGGRDRLASAAKAGLKLAAFRDVLGSRAAPIDEDWEDVEGPGVVAWQKAADQQRKGDVYNALLGAGMKRLPGACRSGKCGHAAHLRFSNALG